MQQEVVLGIDVGASAIKGTPVNIKTGSVLRERLRLETPLPSTPRAMAAVIRKLCRQFDWKEGLIGCGFPAIIKNGVAQSAANIDASWIGVNVEKLLEEVTGCPVKVINDADAAGVGSMRFGDGKGQNGTVILITIGSGLGSALFTDGHLVPNTELGHFYINGILAEQYASSNARKNFDLNWEEWGERFNLYLEHLERLFSPDLILLGGGASKKFEFFSDQIRVKTPVMPDRMLNRAGIVGAAYYAYQRVQQGASLKTR